MREMERLDEMRQRAEFANDVACRAIVAIWDSGSDEGLEAAKAKQLRLNDALYAAATACVREWKRQGSPLDRA